MCQRLCKRLLHHPFQTTEGMQIVCHAVVLDESPIFELVRFDDRKITLVLQLRSVNRFSSLHVAGALVKNDHPRDAQSDTSIDTSLVKASLRIASFHTSLFRVVLEDGHFVP